MAKKKDIKHQSFFDKFSAKATELAGSTYGFCGAAGIVLLWGVCGPIFHYSETWQLVINTGTTIITFLMVFLIQKSQNKESLAIQLKLNELIASHEFASNRLVNSETLTEDELKVIREYYTSLAELTQKEESLQQSHSIDEAKGNHERKKHIEQTLSSKSKAK